MSRPYSSLKPDARLAEQERRYREQMGAEKAGRQKQQKPKPKPKPKPKDKR